MGMLKVKALALAAVVTSWYAVGGAKVVARRVLITVIDQVLGAPKVRRKPTKVNCETSLGLW